MSLNELILSQPKPWLPIRVWNCVVDNAFQLIAGAASTYVMTSDAKGVGTWQNPATTLVTSVASNASVSVNGVSPATATKGAITLAATGTFGAASVTTTTGNITSGTYLAGTSVSVSSIVSIQQQNQGIVASGINANATLSAAQQISSVLVTGALGAAISLQSDTAANLKTQINGNTATATPLTQNQWFTFTICNTEVTAGRTVTVTANTNVTINVAASSVVAPNTQKTFFLKCTDASIPTFTIYS